MKEKLVEIEIELPVELKRKMLKLCKVLNMTVDEFVEDTLKKFIEKHKGEK